MQEQIRVESFIPVLSGQTEFFSIGNTGMGFESPNGSFEHVTLEEQPFVKLIDGQKSLEQIIDVASSDGRLLSTRALLQLIQKLSSHGCLEQSHEELSRFGFQTPRKPKGLGRKLLNLFFNVTLSSKKTTTAESPKILPLGTGTLASVLISSVLAASSLLVWGDLTFDGPPIKLGESHLAGFFAIYMGGVLALTLRNIFRVWALASNGLAPYARGIELRLFLIAPHIDARNAFRAGIQGQRSVALAGLAGAALAAALCCLGVTSDWFSTSIGSHGFKLACFGSLGVLLGCACPVVKSDLGFLLDHMNHTGDGRKHAGSYVSTRYLKGLTKRDMFDGEARLIAQSLGTVLWLYLSFVLGARLISEVLLPSTRSILQSHSLVDSLALVGFVAIVTLTVAGILLTFILGIGGALLKSLPTPSVVPKSFTPDFSKVQEALSNNPLFVQLSSEAIQELANQASAFSFKAGDSIIKEGDWGESFYMLSEGDVEIIHTAPSGVETTVATLHAGDSFGEMALVQSEPRNATVRALGAASVCKVGREAFLKALENANLDRGQITTTLRSTSILRRSELFKGLSPCSLNKLLSLCNRQTVSTGKVLAQEGEQGDHFFIIESGAVEVNQAGQNEPVAALGSGDFFGEISLLSNVPRTATVTTTTESVLLTLNRQDFKDVMVHDFLAGIRLEKIAQERASGVKS
ncbi:MAG: cyclic nucleotide-binding domain-containing protein [Deltaproteobacteria bacterium]|nr:cyclic nucleotide-binding domain-containing protein [Deltaproteobacteria bacterium]